MAGFDWGDLRFFLAIARTGRLTVAARQLRVDHATVGRRLSALEVALKTRLFERTSQGYRLTEQGERMLAAVEAMETKAIEVETTIAGTDRALSGTVRIGAPDGFGTYFLARRLSALLERQPQLTVQLVPLPRVFSLAKREADLVIAIDVPDRSRLKVEHLSDYTLGLYASRAYLKHHAPIKSLDDLKGHRIVTYVPDLLYSEELDYLDELDIPQTMRFECASVIGQMEAVLAGVGVGVLHDYAASSHRELREVLPVRARRAYWIVAHRDVASIARVAYVKDFIVDAVAAERGMFLKGV